MKKLLSLIAVLSLGILAWQLGKGDERSSPSSSGALAQGQLDPSSTSTDAPASLSAAPSGARPGEDPGARVEAPSIDAAPSTNGVATGASPRLRGRLIAPDGSPIPGARVRTMTPGDGFLPRSKEPLAEIRSALDGSFELRAQPARAQELDVLASGFAPFQRSLGPAEREGSLGELVLEPGALLAGRVLDEFGMPVAGAELFLLPPEREGWLEFFDERREASAVSGLDGEFRIDILAVGPWRLLVSHADFPERAEEGITSRTNARILDLLIELEPGADILGRVQGAPEILPRTLEVLARPAERSSELGFDLLLGDGPSELRRGQVEADGSFRVTGLRPGQTYRLTAHGNADGSPENLHMPLEPATRTNSVLARAGQRGVRLDWRASASLGFQVVDAASGAPLSSFVVETGYGDFLMPLSGPDGLLREHPEGRVLIDPMRPSGGNARARLRIQAAGYRDRLIEELSINPGEHRDLGVLAMEPMELLRVSVLDAHSGGAVEGARVSLAPASRETGPAGAISINVQSSFGQTGPGEFIMEQDSGRSGRSDAEGQCTLSSLPGTDALLRITRRGYAPYEARLSLPTGENVEHRAALVPGLELLVQVHGRDSEPMPGVFVEHLEVQTEYDPFFPGAGGGNTSDANGRVIFSELTAGLHHFRLNEDPGDGMGFPMEGPGFDPPGREEAAWTAVEVLAGKENTLTLVAGPRADLTGRVTERGLALAGAQVRLEGEGETFGLMPFPTGPSTTTDAEGRYAFSSVLVKEFLIRVEHPTRAMTAGEPLELREGENRRDLDLDVSIVRGRVSDDEGDPLAGVLMRAERASPGEGEQVRMVFMSVSGGESEASVFSNAGQRTTTTTDADGRFELRGLLSDQPIRVIASKDGYTSAKSAIFELAPDGEREGVDLSLRAAGSLLVTLEESADNALGLALVTATYLDAGQEPVPPRNEVLQGGELLLGQLRPGNWQVELRVLGPPPSSGQPPVHEPQQIEIRAGEEASARF